jgi:DNA polymerase-1
MNYQTLLVDGPYLAHRSYAAPFALKTSSGLPSNVIPTFLRSLLSAHKQFNPDTTIITWESHGTPSWRRDSNPDYKPKKTPDYGFVSQVKDLQHLLFLLGIPQYFSPTNEADDVIATFCEPDATQTFGERQIIIYSVDKDLMQLIEHGVDQFDGKRLYRDMDVIDKFGVSPKLIPDLLALMGDASDNITGIKGYGQVKSSKLIARWGKLENIPKEELQIDSYLQALRNKTLTTLNHKCNLIELTFDANITIESILDKYELKKLKESLEDYKVIGKKHDIESFF